MVYSYDELKGVCNSFTPEALIGKGGFGSVYKGSLRRCAVAVKVLTEVRRTLHLLFCTHIILFK